MLQRLKTVATSVSLLMLGLVLTACGSALKVSSDAAVQDKPALLQQNLPAAVYELAYDHNNQSLFVAGNARGEGVIYRLDPDSLVVKQRIPLEYAAFSLKLNKTTDVLYVGHALDQAISIIDAKNGAELGNIEFDETTADVDLKVREIAVDETNSTLYVGAWGENGAVFVLDANNLELQRIQQNAGGIGLFYDRTNALLYSSASNLKIFDVNNNTTRDVIEVNDKPNSLLLNLALDRTRSMLYATDFNNNDILLFDLNKLELQRRIATAEQPVDIRYNPIRQEVYVSSRSSHLLSVYDANNWQLLKTYSVEQYPNSIELDNTGQYLYLSVKKDPKNKRHNEAVVRIDLNAK